VLKKSLTEPTLLEMSGYGVYQDPPNLRIIEFRGASWHLFQSGQCRQPLLQYHLLGAFHVSKTHPKPHRGLRTTYRSTGFKGRPFVPELNLDLGSFGERMRRIYKTTDKTHVRRSSLQTHMGQRIYDLGIGDEGISRGAASFNAHEKSLRSLV
jgi:hypothetical protein